MKKLLICLAGLLFITVAYAAGKTLEINIPKDGETQKFTYAKVVEVPEVTAADLYQRCRVFLTNKFASDKFAVDEVDSKLVYAGNFEVAGVYKMGMAKSPFSYTTLFTITVQFKDGRYRYELTNFKIGGNAQGTTYEKTLETFVDTKDVPALMRKSQENAIRETCAVIDENVKKLLDEFEKAMAAGPKQEDNW
jgi:hypothetical protein